MEKPKTRTLTPTITQRVVKTARKKYFVDVLDRDDWGSKNLQVYAERRKTRPVTVIEADTLFQHITVTQPSGDFKADARTVERIGMERFGSGVSYNFLVNMKTGQVAVGQALDAKGTHTLNDKGVDGYSLDQNAVARAIAVVGMPDTKLSRAAEKAIAGLIAAMIDEGALTKGFDYNPHSMLAHKDCPCDNTRNRMSDIRANAMSLRKGDDFRPAA